MVPCVTEEPNLAAMYVGRVGRRIKATRNLGVSHPAVCDECNHIPVYSSPRVWVAVRT